ncbi:MAG: nucleotidyltransferase domain-containing protein [Bryobacterales bacterium]|nr:nucleotidyltransferase domain-containing protein [Bryobacteraceae bacterium]MDW8353112.1 nucleotidyltransferase domain-containing protein [Bryobacterales bacterium]
MAGIENASTPAIGDRALAEVVRRLVEAYRPERVYLFGSVARGEAGPDSDYDLLLVVPDDAPPERRRSRLAYEVLWGTGMAADVVVWTSSQFQSRAHLPASLPATVLREGKLLHAA